VRSTPHAACRCQAVYAYLRSPHTTAPVLYLCSFCLPIHLPRSFHCVSPYQLVLCSLRCFYAFLFCRSSRCAVLRFPFLRLPYLNTARRPSSPPDAAVHRAGRTQHQFFTDIAGSWTLYRLSFGVSSPRQFVAAGTRLSLDVLCRTHWTPP